MAVTLETTARNAACNAVVDLLDGPGKLKLLSAADAILVTFALPNPAFGAAAVGVATANAVTPVTAGATGVIAKFWATTSADVTIWSGTVTVGGGGGDMTVDNTSVNTGQTVNVVSWTHTQPA